MTLRLATYFDTDNPMWHDGPEGEPATCYEERRTRCYELACLALVVGAPSDAILHHGSIESVDEPSPLGRIGHAWLVLERGFLDIPYKIAWEPITGLLFPLQDWIRFATPRTEYAYNRSDALLEMAEHDNYGPWKETLFR